MDNRNELRVSELLLRLRCDDISREELNELESIISGDSEAIEYCVDFLMEVDFFQQTGQINIPSISDNVFLTETTDQNTNRQSLLDKIPLQVHSFDYELWKTLAEDEQSALPVYIEKPLEEIDEPTIIEPARLKCNIARFSVFTLAFSTAAMLLFAAMIFFTPVHPIVATLTDSINAEWISKEEISNGDVLRQGELVLTSGFAEITFYDGAVVVVESPAVIELESSKSMFLVSGKVSAVVSGYATGFTVNMLSASIIDLGTEFGVSVGGDGSCDMQMFKGKANLIVGKKKAKKTSQIVNANEAKSIEIATGIIRDGQFGNKNFVRQIDSEKGFIWRGEELNLADIVGGGNGFGSGVIDRVVSIDTGMVSIRSYDSINHKPTPGKCIEVPGLPFVDCLFVPDGGIGIDQVTLSGKRFEQCPDTSGNSHGDISNGGIVQHESNRFAKLVLDEVVYGNQQRSAIYIHGNQGITFDLDAIRRSLPGTEIVKFTSLCGISQTVVNDPVYNGIEPNTSFWVLIDGKVRFSKKQARLSEKASQVSIELTGQDRYLSLAVTDGDGIDGFDWGVFALPEIEVRSIADNTSILH